MRHGSVVYCMDVATKMIDAFETRFKLNEFSLNSDNFFKRLKESEITDVESMNKIESDLRTGPFGKGVFALEGDVECLPFPDDSFDSY